jgi:hypothetical protein
MENRIKVHYNCIGRVHYISLDPELLPLTPAETPLFAGVTTAWNQLKSWALGQEGGKRAFHEGVFERIGAVRLLRQDMVAIAEMARSIELSGVDPGISERFRMPSKRTYATMVASAEAFAEAAETAKALFTARGMAATFVDDLEAKIALVGGGEEARAGGLTRQNSGTAGLRIVAKQGMDFVRQLRPMVRARLKDKPALAAAWNLACRVESRSSVGSPPDEGSGGSGSGGTTPPPSGSGS